jgi:hypothetical protein
MGHKQYVAVEAVADLRHLSESTVYREYRRYNEAMLRLVRELMTDANVLASLLSFHAPDGEMKTESVD